MANGIEIEPNKKAYAEVEVLEIKGVKAIVKPIKVANKIQFLILLFKYLYKINKGGNLIWDF